MIGCSSLGLFLWISSITGLHLEFAAELSAPELDEIAALLARSVEARSQGEVRRDPQTASSCAPLQECVQEIRGRLAASDLVLYRAIGGASRLRLTLIWIPQEGLARTERVDLDPDQRSGWQQTMEQTIERLIPAVEPPPVAVESPPAPQPNTEAPPPILAPPPNVGPTVPELSWLSWGLSAASIGTGVALFASAEASLTSLETALGPRDAEGRYSGLSYEEANRQKSSIEVRRTASAALFAVATGLAVAGWYLFFAASRSASPAESPLAAGPSGVVISF